MNIHTLTPCDADRWNSFVDSSPAATFFHRTEWKEIIERTFNFASLYLFAEKDAVIQGVLPLFHVKGLFSGNALISTPFAVYGGILAATTVARDALYAACKEKAERLGAEFVELRHFTPIDIPELTTRDSLYVTFVKEMPERVQDIYEQLPKEARRMVRKGRSNGLTTRMDRDDVDTFYNIYAVSVRKFGTPVFPKKLFQTCLEVLQDKASILYVYDQDKVIAGVMSFYHKDTVLPYYSGMLSDVKSVAPHNLMYLALMEDARERGYRTFDFGRSKIGTGPASFKKHMGFEPMNLPYQFYLRNGKDLPNRNQTNPKYAKALNIWKRLPLPVTKIVGPHVVKMFP
ncbi:FemAB family PEP-CTERM system-associated protein [candidate division KSB1 bacterium]|nr:FemAB family PEP-CTERM system-associated protein [candidate division KSB1 bacterium]RQW09433.1 MAG: FemAB family PEP-CTERM system-associated protein [candidate division KSB1 bacterium]